MLNLSVNKVFKENTQIFVEPEHSKQNLENKNTFENVKPVVNSDSQTNFESNLIKESKFESKKKDQNTLTVEQEKVIELNTIKNTVETYVKNESSVSTISDQSFKSKTHNSNIGPDHSVSNLKNCEDERVSNDNSGFLQLNVKNEQLSTRINNLEIQNDNDKFSLTLNKDPANINSEKIQNAVEFSENDSKMKPITVKDKKDKSNYFVEAIGSIKKDVNIDNITNSIITTNNDSTLTDIVVDNKEKCVKSFDHVTFDSNNNKSSKIFTNDVKTKNIQSINSPNLENLKNENKSKILKTENNLEGIKNKSSLESKNEKKKSIEKNSSSKSVTIKEQKKVRDMEKRSGNTKNNIICTKENKIQKTTNKHFVSHEGVTEKTLRVAEKMTRDLDKSSNEIIRKKSEIVQKEKSISTTKETIVRSQKGSEKYSCEKSSDTTKKGINSTQNLESIKAKTSDKKPNDTVFTKSVKQVKKEDKSESNSKNNKISESFKRNSSSKDSCQKVGTHENISVCKLLNDEGIKSNRKDEIKTSSGKLQSILQKEAENKSTNKIKMQKISDESLGAKDLKGKDDVKSEKNNLQTKSENDVKSKECKHKKDSRKEMKELKKEYDMNKKQSSRETTTTSKVNGKHCTDSNKQTSEKEMSFKGSVIKLDEIPESKRDGNRLELELKIKSKSKNHMSKSVTSEKLSSENKNSLKVKDTRQTKKLVPTKTINDLIEIPKNNDLFSLELNSNPKEIKNFKETAILKVTKDTSISEPVNKLQNKEEDKNKLNKICKNQKFSSSSESLKNTIKDEKNKILNISSVTDIPKKRHYDNSNSITKEPAAKISKKDTSFLQTTTCIDTKTDVSKIKLKDHVTLKNCQNVKLNNEQNKSDQNIQAIKTENKEVLQKSVDLKFPKIVSVTDIKKQKFDVYEFNDDDDDILSPTYEKIEHGKCDVKDNKSNVVRKIFESKAKKEIKDNRKEMDSVHNIEKNLEQKASAPKNIESEGYTCNSKTPITYTEMANILERAETESSLSSSKVDDRPYIDEKRNIYRNPCHLKDFEEKNEVEDIKPPESKRKKAGKQGKSKKRGGSKNQQTNKESNDLSESLIEKPPLTVCYVTTTFDNMNSDDKNTPIKLRMKRLSRSIDHTENNKSNSIEFFNLQKTSSENDKTQFTLDNCINNTDQKFSSPTNSKEKLNEVKVESTTNEVIEPKHNSEPQSIYDNEKKKGRYKKGKIASTFEEKECSSNLDDIETESVSSKLSFSDDDINSDKSYIKGARKHKNFVNNKCRKRGRPKIDDSSSVTTDDNIQSGSELIIENDNIKNIEKNNSKKLKYEEHREKNENRHEKLEEKKIKEDMINDDKIDSSNEKEIGEKELKAVLQDVIELSTKLEMSSRTDSNISETLNSKDHKIIKETDVRVTILGNKSDIHEKNEKEKVLSAIFKRTLSSPPERDLFDNSSCDNLQDNAIDSNTEAQKLCFLNISSKSKKLKNCFIKLKKFSKRKMRRQQHGDDVLSLNEHCSDEENSLKSVISSINNFNKLLNSNKFTENVSTPTTSLIADTKKSSDCQVNSPPIMNNQYVFMKKCISTSSSSSFSITDNPTQANNISSSDLIVTKQLHNNTNHNANENELTYFAFPNETAINNRLGDTMHCSSIFPIDLDLSDAFDFSNIIPDDKSSMIHSTPDRQRANSDFLEKVVNEEGNTISTSIKVDHEFGTAVQNSNGVSSKTNKNLEETKSFSVSNFKDTRDAKDTKQTKDMKCFKPLKDIKNPNHLKNSKFTSLKEPNDFKPPTTEEKCDIKRNETKPFKHDKKPDIELSNHLDKKPSVPVRIKYPIKRDRERCENSSVSNPNQKTVAHFHTPSGVKEHRERQILISPSKLDNITQSIQQSIPVEKIQNDKSNLPHMPLLDDSIQINNDNTLEFISKDKTKRSINEKLVGLQLPKKVPQFNEMCDLNEVSETVEKATSNNFNQAQKVMNQNPTTVIPKKAQTKTFTPTVRPIATNFHNFQSSYEQFATSTDFQESSLRQTADNLLIQQQKIIKPKLLPDKKPNSIVINQQIIPPPCSLPSTKKSALQQNQFLKTGSLSFKPGILKRPSTEIIKSKEKISRDNHPLVMFNNKIDKHQTSGIFIVEKTSDCFTNTVPTANTKGSQSLYKSPL
ncbi:uncharacterized protein LOC129609289 [Condylostylus longicornis]|uniref:uncharacterized protein LOC129609289 n=1 Tax=Condylostylus longicornis TaxID=2530218 RepID=UPI00244DBED0|nr:uncharacterized protein LOC129609289 [Condylostylus longicornis]